MQQALEFRQAVFGIATRSRPFRDNFKRLENLISSGEEPHCPPLTAGLSALSLTLSLTLSLSLSLSRAFGPRRTGVDPMRTSGGLV